MKYVAPLLLLFASLAHAESGSDKLGLNKIELLAEVGRWWCVGVVSKGRTVDVTGVGNKVTVKLRHPEGDTGYKVDLKQCANAIHLYAFSKGWTWLEIVEDVRAFD